MGYFLRKSPRTGKNHHKIKLLMHFNLILWKRDDNRKNGRPNKVVVPNLGEGSKEGREEVQGGREII